jgi:uncharacterized protein
VRCFSGIFAGFGSRLGSGCTSGHGAVGLARLSPRSFAAVGTFMATGFLAAGLSRASYIRPYLYSDAARVHQVQDNLYLLPLVAVLTVYVFYRIRWHTSPAPSASQDSKLALSLLEKLGAQLVAYCVGLLCGVGLALSGMCNPAKVLTFLDAFGETGFDPQLMAVLGAAVGINAAFFYSMKYGSLSRSFPICCSAAANSEMPGASKPQPFSELIAYGPSAPANRRMDWKLFTGSAVFGVGWGLSGACPGLFLKHVF